MIIEHIFTMHNVHSYISRALPAMLCGAAQRHEKVKTQCAVALEVMITRGGARLTVAKEFDRLLQVFELSKKLSSQRFFNMFFSFTGLPCWFFAPMMSIVYSHFCTTIVPCIA